MCSSEAGDAVEVARRAVGRVIHVHLKDVDAGSGRPGAVGRGSISPGSYLDGMFVPLGHRAPLTSPGSFESWRQTGIGAGTCWSRMSPLPTIPRPDGGPKADAVQSIEFLRRLAPVSLTGVSHPVWFERPVPAEFADEIGPRIEVSGPGTGSDPFFGIESAAGVIASVLRYDGPVMDRASRALAIVRTGIGYDRVDVDAATEQGHRGLQHTQRPHRFDRRAHHRPPSGRHQRRSRIRRTGFGAASDDLYTLHEAIELEGKTLGLVGFGRIARRVAAVARSLGMEVVAFDPFLAQDADAVTRIDNLDELLNSADVVSVHVPLTGETRGLFDQRRFAAMKPGSFLHQHLTGRGRRSRRARGGPRHRTPSGGGSRRHRSGASAARSSPAPSARCRGDPARGLCHRRGEAQDLPFGTGRSAGRPGWAADPST